MRRLWLLLGACLTLAAAPSVTKVDPPNWWVDHTINPVRLLVRGTELAGARVEATDAGVDVVAAHANARGTYLFVDVRIKATGQHPLRVTTDRGSASIPFEVLAPLAAEGRFQGFSQDDLIYLIMPDRFSNGDPSNDDPAISKGLFNPADPHFYHGGDLQGILDHLPYLKDLGVTAIWINPLYDNVNHLNQIEKAQDKPVTDYHGYGAVDFYAVDEHFGDGAKFRELTDAAHRSGIKIILDMVANHTGPYHPWVTDSPTPTWYHGTREKHLNETWQTWAMMDPHAASSVTKPVLDGWFADILPDLNQDDPEVARYIIQNTLWWAGISGMDGIRQDTLSYVPRSFWRDWMAAIKKQYPHLYVVGEVLDGDPALTSFFQGGQARGGIDTGVDSVFDFPQYFALRKAFGQGQQMNDFAAMLAHDYLYPDPNNLVTLLGLHDVQRFMNEPKATVESLKLAFTYLLTSRGIPMIYYGDEIAMRGGDDPDNRRDFPVAAFGASGRTSEQQNVWAYVRKLAQLRAQYPALRRGSMQQLAVTASAYVYRRGDLLVFLNKDANAADLTAEAQDGSWKDLLEGVGPVAALDGRVTVRVPGLSAVILRREQ
ncbi:MAG TPA: alpha-amylase family glycosyl hydrolase [Bryobacteraceae bacterium]|nr:alpha-amylase family glycosyl hydrolase [Bryobacteraceae bacterium]